MCKNEINDEIIRKKEIDIYREFKGTLMQI